MDGTPGSAVTTARGTEFSKSKPLPPIGGEEESGQETDRSSKSKADDDAKSTTSSSGHERKGEGSARPRIVRGFRPEKFSDDEDDADNRAGRSVSFNGSALETTKRRTYDGRELVMVTLDTQTDWDWVEEVEHSGTARTMEGSEKSLDFSSPEKDETPRGKKVTMLDDKKGQSPKPASRQDDELKGSSVTPSYNMPYNDEYGIPILDLSSDTDDSSDEETAHKKMNDDRSFLPSVGPPNILQAKSHADSRADSRAESYQRESEKHDITVDDPEARLKFEDFEKDAEGVPHGMFSGNCEFCNKPIKAFPSLEQQQQLQPEQLYCCNEYREFVEYVIRQNMEAEEEANKKKKLIDIKPHQHVGSKQERNAAKEKAVQRLEDAEIERYMHLLMEGPDLIPHVGREVPYLPVHPWENGGEKNFYTQMRERELARRQQEATGMQQNFFASPPYSTGGSGTPHHKVNFGKMGNMTMKDMYAGAPSGGVGHSSKGQAPSGGVADLSPYTPPQTAPIASGGGTTPRLTMNMMMETAFARQMKTINYQLSSQKCLEEGWTLRPPSPLDDDLGDDVFIPEPLNPAMIADGKLRERPLIEKYYEHGQKFLTMFPDGTGNVFYPSGNLAILISSVKLGQYYYTIHHDYKRSDVAAAFEPNGYGYCYFPNGAVRLYIDQYGGLELDGAGGKKRKWSWKDQVTHVHAPPFQPICIGINRNMGLRVMSQENIALTFASNKRSCRFNMGSRLKLVAPENAPVREVEEEHIFLEEKKVMVERLLQKVDNLLKYPNNPKIDKMLPPLSTTSKENKTAKMKKDRQVFIAQQAAKEKKQSSIAVNT